MLKLQSLFKTFSILVIASVLHSGTALAGSTLKTEVVTASQEAFGTNAAIVYGKKEAILIDATFTLSDAEKLAQRVKKTGLPLTSIYLTHGHPDHAFGLARILEHFPNAKIYARQGVIDELDRDFLSKLLRWGVVYPDNLATTLPEILLLKGKIYIEGNEIKWQDTKRAESHDATVYYIPAIKTLFAGDLLFHKMHMYIPDVADPLNWLVALQQVEDAFSDAEIVIPGHGAEGNKEIIHLNRQYLQDYLSVAEMPFPDLKLVGEFMMKKYPDYDWPMILHMTRGPAVTHPEVMKLYSK